VAASPPMTTSSGSKAWIVGDADADALTPDVHHPGGGLVAAERGLDDLGAEHRLALGTQPGEGRAGTHAPGDAGEAVQRMAGGRVLERAGLREAHRRGHGAREVEAEDRVPELARGARRPAVDPPAEHESAADVRADGDHHQVAGDEREVGVVRLGERGGVDRVVDERRDAEPLGQLVAQRDAGQRQLERAVRRRRGRP
jgi:hypothetical protein